MRIKEQVDEKLERIYEEFKEDGGDLTGWTLLQNLKKESNSEEGLLEYFIYTLFKIAYKKREVINVFNLLTNFISYPYHKESYLNYPGKKNSSVKEIFPKLFFKRDILTKILELLQLKETLTAFYYSLIVKEEEINEKNYLSKKQISEFRGFEISQTRVLDIFRNEYKKNRLNKRPKIIKFNR